MKKIALISLMVLAVTGSNFATTVTCPKTISCTDESAQSCVVPPNFELAPDGPDGSGASNGGTFKVGALNNTYNTDESHLVCIYSGGLELRPKGHSVAKLTLQDGRKANWKYKNVAHTKVACMPENGVEMGIINADLCPMEIVD